MLKKWNKVWKFGTSLGSVFGVLNQLSNSPGLKVVIQGRFFGKFDVHYVMRSLMKSLDTRYSEVKQAIILTLWY